MRVEMDFSKQGSSANTFLVALKSKFPDLEIKKLEGFKQYKLLIDAKFKNRTTNKTDLQYRIYDALKGDIIFHASAIKIGKAVKCTTCGGTGKSYYPNDFFANVPDEKLKMKKRKSTFSQNQQEKK